MPRTFGIALGVATHVVFLATVYYLFCFLDGDTHPIGSLWLDAALALQFVVPHSALLHPRVRKKLEPLIGGAFYGLFFCLVTCLQLSLIFAGWRSNSTLVWQLTGVAGMAMEAAFYGSWVALFYSLWLTGLGYQTGWTPWWYWLYGQKPPRRDFRPSGAYRLLRHPVYLSFLGLIWFHPTLSLDKLVLLAIWTPYIFVGSVLKDYRLEYYLGERYRAYRAEVAGYPGMLFGPLARISRSVNTSAAPSGGDTRPTIGRSLAIRSAQNATCTSSTSS